MTDAVWQIERRRRELGLSQSRLAGLAGIAPRNYFRIAAREVEPRRNTIAKLKLALRRHAAGGDVHLSAQLVYRLCLLAVCQHEKADIRAVQAQDPGRRATFDPVWRQAAEIRSRALYLAHSICSLPQAQLAAAAGVTTAAVSLAMGRVEDAGEPEDDPLFQLVETAIGGL